MSIVHTRNTREKKATRRTLSDVVGIWTEVRGASATSALGELPLFSVETRNDIKRRIRNLDNHDLVGLHEGSIPPDELEITTKESVDGFDAKIKSYAQAEMADRARNVERYLAQEAHAAAKQRTNIQAAAMFFAALIGAVIGGVVGS